jgi:hypothetical protein
MKANFLKAVGKFQLSLIPIVSAAFVPLGRLRFVLFVWVLLKNLSTGCQMDSIKVRNLFNLPAWSVIDDMEDKVDSVSDAGGG